MSRRLLPLLSLSALAALALLALSACPTEPAQEGTSAGDCVDGADNDADGDFDCNDSGCTGSPDCGGGDDDDDATDDDDAVGDDDDNVDDDDVVDDDDDNVDCLDFNVVVEAAEGFVPDENIPIVVVAMRNGEYNPQGFPAGKPVDSFNTGWTGTSISDGFCLGGETFGFIAFANNDNDDICSPGDFHGFTEALVTDRGEATITLDKTLNGDECERGDPPE